MSQPAQGSCPGCPSALQHHPPRPSGPQQCPVASHPPPLPAKEALTPVPWFGVPQGARIDPSHLQSQHGRLLGAPPVVSDHESLVPLRRVGVLHKAVPGGIIEDLREKGA